MLIQPLRAGPVDVVGDVHGERAALQALLAQLGYDASGVHPQGRCLVFVGDLIDRGPESAAVLDWVLTRVREGRAQCVMGNHELALLRGEPRPRGDWFLMLPEARRMPLLAGIATLPLALERPGLRVVHAAWIAAAVSAVRDDPGPVLETYARYERVALERMEREGLRSRAAAEATRWADALHDPSVEPPPLPALAESDERYQMENPVRVLTSGAERRTAPPYWASGKWRYCDRLPWWEAYRDDDAVIVGHYWRQARYPRHARGARARPELFGSSGPFDWLGPARNVFCVDYSVGARYEERGAVTLDFDTQLCAVRWPEREIWGESGRLA